MSGSFSGGSQNQHSQQSGTSNTTQSGTSSGTSTGGFSNTGSITPTTTAGWNSTDAQLQGLLGPTGLNQGQQTASDAWSSYLQDPNNGVSQMLRYNGQLQPFTTSQANTAAASGPVVANSAASNMGNNQSPFTQQVVDATKADAFNSLKTGLNEINANYGGSLGNGRAGVAAGEAVGDFTRGLTSNIAGLRSQGFDTANKLGAVDAGNQLSASGQNANLGQQLNMFNAGQGDTADARAMGAIQQMVGNAGTEQQLGGQAVQQQYNMAGGGLNNLFQYLGIQPQGQSSAQSGSQSGSQSGTTSSIMDNIFSGMSSGGGSSKGGGLGFG